MIKNTIYYNGKGFQCYVIEGCKVDTDCMEGVNYLVAPHSLWDEIKEDYANDVDEAIDIDNQIFFYFDDRADCEEKIITYIKNNLY